MPRLSSLYTACLTLSTAGAQVNLGAGAGWSHSEPLDQGGPAIGLLADIKDPNGAVRLSLCMQLPTTRYTAFVDDGNGRMLSAGGWNDGHTRSVRGTKATSMLSLGADRLFLIDRDRDDDRTDLLLGPGIDLMVEGIRTERHIYDRTDSTFTLERSDGERLSASLRVVMSATYRLPIGALVIEAITQVATCSSGDHSGGSPWLQRQTIRAGAVFPLPTNVRKPTPPVAPE